MDEACDKLASFVDEVEAQLAREIYPATADALIADAGTLERSIGCVADRGQAGCDDARSPTRWAAVAASLPGDRRLAAL